MTMDLVRQRFFEAKLGELPTWSCPDIIRTVGPHDPSIFEDHDAHRRKIVAECTALLRDYSED